MRKALMLLSAALCLLALTAGCVDDKPTASQSPARTKLTVSIPPMPSPSSSLPFPSNGLELVPMPTVSIGRIPGLSGG